MRTVESQVCRARRRIILGLFGRALIVTLFVALVLSTLAVASTALWVIDVSLEIWALAWVAGSVGAALLAAAGYAVYRTPSSAAVAALLDQRFGLRERLSSSLLMDGVQRQTPFGNALVADAERRASQLAVADKFALRPNKWSWLPVSMIPVLALALFFAEPAQRLSASSQEPDAAEVEQVKTAVEQLKKRIQTQRRKAEVEGLEESEDLFRKMEADLDKIAKQNKLNRKDAMIAMNDLKKELEQRREQLGSPEQVQRALSQMKGMDDSPAKKVAESIAKGEFDKAQQLVQDLAKKLKDNKLSDAEKEQLKNQISQMRDQLQQAAEQHEQKKEQLRQQIEQARREGRGEDAAKMQQQLNGLEHQDGQMQKMQQMADAMQKAAQAMESGQSAEAAEALDEIGEQLNEMQQEMSEMEELQEALDKFSESKSQMRCKSCGGGGCEGCRSQGDSKGGSNWGTGRGSGTGPETDTETETYDTQVRGDVKPGQAITAGTAAGPNRKGVSQEQIREAVENVLSNESDPLENQTLPRDEREHAEQYFNQLREGK